MFDDADPLLARVRELALGFPEAQQKVSHGRPAFFTTKVFCYYGGSVKIDGEWVPHDQSIMVQANSADREALRQLAGAYVPAYLGPSGWTGLDVDADTDWDEVRDLLEDSYRMTASARLVSMLS